MKSFLTYASLSYKQFSLDIYFTFNQPQFFTLMIVSNLALIRYFRQIQHKYKSNSWKQQYVAHPLDVYYAQLSDVINLWGGMSVKIIAELM